MPERFCITLEAIPIHSETKQPFKPFSIEQGDVVRSRMHGVANEQKVKIDKNEQPLSQLINVIKALKAKGASAEEMIATSTLLVAQNLKEGSTIWDQMVARGTLVTLNECIQRETNTCFHRAIMFNLLMQEAGIPCMPVAGKFIDSDRLDLTEMPGSSIKNALSKNEFVGYDDDFSPHHMWNVISLDGELKLIDTAKTVKVNRLNPKIQRTIVVDLSNTSEGSLFSKKTAFKIPTDPPMFRHYIMSPESEIEMK